MLEDIAKVKHIQNAILMVRNATVSYITTPSRLAWCGGSQVERLLDSGPPDLQSHTYLYISYDKRRKS